MNAFFPESFGDSIIGS